MTAPSFEVFNDLTLAQYDAVGVVHPNTYESRNCQSHEANAGVQLVTSIFLTKWILKSVAVFYFTSEITKIYFIVCYELP